MIWYRVDMTMERVQDGAFHRLCREFQQAFIANGAPNDMALFALAAPEDGTRRLYFSPGCAVYVKPLIDGHGGVPCDVPDDPAVTLMFGVPGARCASFSIVGDGAVGEEPMTAGGWIPGEELSGMDTSPYT